MGRSSSSSFSPDRVLCTLGPRRPTIQSWVAAGAAVGAPMALHWEVRPGVCGQLIYWLADADDPKRALLCRKAYSLAVIPFTEKSW